jgi:hypothetical protein
MKYEIQSGIDGWTAKNKDESRESCLRGLIGFGGGPKEALDSLLTFEERELSKEGAAEKVKDQIEIPLDNIHD